ncbi:MAG: Gfo/Idh/MocA family oxidoreductase, partial [Isosphaeraceae bacterium]|nr:Gfo/Idh/MocA family oxidoreductase [Isosphaeraceae bacterium]
MGLGRLWEARHKPALARLTDRFQVTAVYDQVMRRAAVEAAQWRCAAVEGLEALIERPDVDVVYLLTPQWFGLHPAELACAHGKPIYCALPLAGDLADLERLAERVQATGTPFVPELARRFYPATLRLRELLATTLGPPRLILGQNRLFGFDRYGQPGPSTQLVPLPLAVDPGSYLLDWCRFIFGREPTGVLGFGSRVLP